MTPPNKNSVVEAVAKCICCSHFGCQSPDNCDALRGEYRNEARAASKALLREQWKFINAMYGKAEYLPHDVARAFARSIGIKLEDGGWLKSASPLF